MYSFDPEGDGKGGPKLLWKFDANPKDSIWVLGGRGTRNNIIATPVVYEGNVYVAVGQDPEHGEGIGHLWCIDPTKRGDVSPELAFNSEDDKKTIPHKRIQAVVAEEGDFARPNPNSAVIWHYSESDNNNDGRHRLRGNDAPYLWHGRRSRTTSSTWPTSAGLFHCIDARTGQVALDLRHAWPPAWGSATMVVDGKVYIGDEDGDVAIFRHSADPNVAMKDDDGEMIPHFGEVNMGNSVYSTPIVADNVLYISNRTHLFAIESQEE